MLTRAADVLEFRWSFAKTLASTGSVIACSNDDLRNTFRRTKRLAILDAFG